MHFSAVAPLSGIGRNLGCSSASPRQTCHRCGASSPRGGFGDVIGGLRQAVRLAPGAACVVEGWPHSCGTRRRRSRRLIDAAGDNKHAGEGGLSKASMPHRRLMTCSYRRCTEITVLGRVRMITPPSSLLPRPDDLLTFRSSAYSPRSWTSCAWSLLWIGRGQSHGFALTSFMACSGHALTHKPHARH